MRSIEPNPDWPLHYQHPFNLLSLAIRQQFFNLSLGTLSLSSILYSILFSLFSSFIYSVSILLFIFSFQLSFSIESFPCRRARLSKHVRWPGANCSAWCWPCASPHPDATRIQRGIFVHSVHPPHACEELRRRATYTAVPWAGPLVPVSLRRCFLFWRPFSEGVPMFSFLNNGCALSEFGSPCHGDSHSSD